MYVGDGVLGREINNKICIYLYSVYLRSLLNSLDLMEAIYCKRDRFEGFKV